MKKHLYLLTAISCLLTLNGCNSQKDDPYKATITYQKEASLTTIVDSFATEEIKTSPMYNVILGMATEWEQFYVGEGTVTYKRYKITYPSEMIDGSKVMLSGAITIPFNNGNCVTNGIVVSSHPTFTDLSEAPSNDFDMYCVPVITGSIVIECDLLGYGISSDKPVDYHCSHLSSRNTVDGIIAAKKLLKDELQIDTSTLKIVSEGYSQGGYDSLGLLKYMETEATDEEKSEINIVTTVAGSGAYNPILMFEKSITNSDFEYSEYLLMAIMTAFNFHADKMGALTYEQVLTDKGLQLLEILTHKNDEELQQFKTLNIKSPSDVFKPNCFDNQSDLFKAMAQIVAEENLLDEEWTPTGELYIYYSEGDELVTPECSYAAIALWGELENFTSGEIGFLVGPDHRSAAIDFYIYLISIIADSFGLSI